MASSRFLRLLTAVGTTVASVPVLAQEPPPAPPPVSTCPGGACLQVTMGTWLPYLAIVTNIMTFLVYGISLICAALFMIGAFFWVFSRGKEEWVSKGKEFMLGSLIGLGVVLGSAAIVRTFYYLLFIAE